MCGGILSSSKFTPAKELKKKRRVVLKTQNYFTASFIRWNPKLLTGECALLTSASTQNGSSYVGERVCECACGCVKKNPVNKENLKYIPSS